MGQIADWWTGRKVGLDMQCKLVQALQVVAIPKMHQNTGNLI